MTNELYPIFLKAHKLEILIVGGGNVALEKMNFLLKSSPRAKISLVATAFIPAVMELIYKHQFHFCQKAYQYSDLFNKAIVIGATNDEKTNIQIFENAKTQGLLVNIADQPSYCDFYMGGIVTKGNLKIAISTNGKSPTMAKRLRQLFEDVLPDNVDSLLYNLNHYRSTLRGDFEYKVNRLNNLTKSILSKSN